MMMTYRRLLLAALLLTACGGPPAEDTTTPDPKVYAMVEPGIAVYQPPVPLREAAAVVPSSTTTTTVVVPETTTTITTVPEAEPEVLQTAAVGDGYGDPSNPATWDRLAECEAWGDWSLSTGNGYYGGLQFSLGSWEAVGGSGYPHEASREEQISRAQILWQDGGWSHWPACSRKLGY